MTLVLKASPDWHSAAQTLVDGCNALNGMEDRVRLIEQFADKLGDQLYPAFIQILSLISVCGDSAAKSLLTEALLHAMQSGRLPSGRLAAWGAMQTPANNRFGQARSLGPVEYLCAWYAQPSGRAPLSEHAFRVAAGHLIDLFDSNTAVKRLYCAKMCADLEDPLGGALSRGTQDAMLKLVKSWQQNLPANDIIGAYLDTIRNQAHNRLSGIGGPFFNR